jgi:hypothetical protein
MAKHMVNDGPYRPHSPMTDVCHAQIHSPSRVLRIKTFCFFLRSSSICCHLLCPSFTSRTCSHARLPIANPQLYTSTAPPHSHTPHLVEYNNNSTMADRPPTRNAYFQTAVLDPSLTMSPLQRPTFSALTGTIKLTIGPPPSQRTWHLPRSLLARHSRTLGLISANAFQTAVSLPHLDARAFANFVDYMRSSIYSLNEHVPAFRAVPHHTHAYVLGTALGARAYSAAAMRQLHSLFAPLALLPSSSRRKSVVRAEDVALAWGATREGDALRRLVADAVASHWTQRDVSDVARLAGWKDLDGGFTAMLAASAGIAGSGRAALLGAVEEYLGGATALRRDGGGDGEARAWRANDTVGARPPFVRPMSRIPSFTRRAVSDRRRRERAKVMDVDAEAVRDWREDGMSDLVGEEGSAVEEERSAVEDDLLVAGAEITRGD